MSISLDGKVAVITGAASGIGRASVERFVEAGAKVLAADIDEAGGRLLEVAFPGQVVFQTCDVMSEDDIAVTMEVASQTFGGLDILFNNAGAGGSPTSLEEMTGELWDYSQNLLLRSVALGMRYAIPHMKARGGGAIVNTASVAALSAGMGPIAYSAAKAGVLHLSKCAAAELSKYSIRVNAICPGFILTNIFTPGDMPSQIKSAVQLTMRSGAHMAQPIQRPGEADDIAQAALYLAGPASGFVTGTHIVVDGGMLVGPRSSWDPEEQGRRIKEREKLWAGAAELSKTDA
ncbi:MAG: SDR family NAD(P)-dependent oxidoreductase [Caulobacter sp.]|nr:SDR family NAD(P)-dependent oxidoreductase [Caulobacter sp.]